MTGGASAAPAGSPSCGCSYPQVPAPQPPFAPALFWPELFWLAPQLPAPHDALAPSGFFGWVVGVVAVLPAGSLVPSRSGVIAESPAPAVLAACWALQFASAPLAAFVPAFAPELASPLHDAWAPSACLLAPQLASAPEEGLASSLLAAGTSWAPTGLCAGGVLVHATAVDSAARVIAIASNVSFSFISFSSGDGIRCHPLAASLERRSSQHG